MKKIVIIFIAFFAILMSNFNVYACEYNCNHNNDIKFREFDRILNERLNFTPEQKILIRKNHSQFKSEMDVLIADMQKEHDKIKNIYNSSVPEIQADIKTIPMKAKLVLLKRRADILRDNNRKNFEKLLSDSQKLEFEKIKAKLRSHN